jgi:hypothetical protein
MNKTTTGLPLRSGLLALALFGLAPLARADIFLCVDAQGRKELTDTNRPGCKPLDVPGAIPAPKRGSGGGRASSTPVATPAGFPKVDSAQQKERDANRREILEAELAQEERKLNELRKEFNNGEPERQGGEKNYAKYQERVAQLKEAISRTEKNIEALRREIGNIK